METMYEQTSFLENNETHTQTDNAQKTYTGYRTYSGRQYPARRPSYEKESHKPIEKTDSNFVRRNLSNKVSDKPEELFVRRSLPNKAFDQEYMTEWGREVKFLADKGIPYTYVKRTPDYGISQFKYKKTPELFEALKEFYSQVEVERSNLADADEVQKVLKGAGITIQRGRNGAIKFIKDEPESDKPAEAEDVIE